ncbi:MAG: ABC transporter permease [Gammaproteobacteria bacterium]|nr:MAG: ABC transporter permease [Gammaproteobacteria bacterium]
MNALLQVLALVRKEFLALLRDPRSRLVLIGPPMIQLMVFGYAATFDLNDVPVAVHNADRGALSRQLLARVEGSPAFHLVAEVDAEEALRELINERRAMLALSFDPNFSRDIEQGRSGRLQAILDGRNSNSALIALGYLRNILIDFNQGQSLRQGGPPLPAVLKLRAWHNENMTSRWFIVPGIVGLLLLVVTLVVTALSIAREREAGTFDQLLVTPLHPWQTLLGKSIPGLVIGLLEASFIVLLAVAWFEVPLRGSLGALYLGIFLFLLSAVGVGLMISAISVTQQQALLGAFLFLVPAVILSGFATPIANMPEVVQWISHLDPLRYFLVIVRGVFLEGADAGLLIHQYWPMALIGGIALPVAGWLARHRMY